MKRILIFLISIGICLSQPFHITSYAQETKDTIQIESPSAILMETTTGMVLYEKHADEKLAPASVTKVMTMLLIFEAIESGKIKLEDTVSVSE